MPSSTIDDGFEISSPIVINKNINSRQNHLSDTSEQIIQLLRSYSPTEGGLGLISRPDFEQSVRKAVRDGQPLNLILPAFPFKSPNNIDKVLGLLPDLGEEIALARLEGLCADLERKFCKTKLSIVSDGLVYNGMLHQQTKLEFELINGTRPPWRSGRKRLELRYNSAPTGSREIPPYQLCSSKPPCIAWLIGAGDNRRVQANIGILSREIGTRSLTSKL
jgi:hypothetical protein